MHIRKRLEISNRNFIAEIVLMLTCTLLSLSAHAQTYTDVLPISGTVEEITGAFEQMVYGGYLTGELTVEATSLLEDREITLDELYSMSFDIDGLCISSDVEDCNTIPNLAVITSIDAVSITLPSGYEGFLQGGFTITLQFYTFGFEYFTAQLVVDLTQGTFLIASSDPDDPGFSTLSGSVQMHLYTDSDFDGRIDSYDNCVTATNPSQSDTDQDGFGDACDQDFNNDCRVNFLDFAMFANHLGTSDPLYDLTEDGVVDFLDYSLVVSRFGYSPGPSANGFDVLESCF